MTTPEPSVAPIARVPSKVSGMSSSCGQTKVPAAPPSKTACNLPVPAHAAGEINQIAERRAHRNFIDAGARDVSAKAEQSGAGGIFRADAAHRPRRHRG